MSSAITQIEEMLQKLAQRQGTFPYQEILLTRLCMNMNSRLLENRNIVLKEHGINETLFTALITIDAQDSQSIQPSELSTILGSSRTNATRIADELEKRGWIERRESENDRRCLHLYLTRAGKDFLGEVLPHQHQYLKNIWSALNEKEQRQLEATTRKLLSRFDQMERKSVD